MKLIEYHYLTELEAYDRELRFWELVDAGITKVMRIGDFEV